MTTTMTAVTHADEAFAAVQASAETIRNDETQIISTVSPGDVIRQGDVYLIAMGPALREGELGDLLPEALAERQMAPGTTQGSRHILEGPAVGINISNHRIQIAAELNRLVKDGVIEPDLVGPVFRTDGPCTLTHPEHGNFELPAGETFAVVYQRAFAEEVRRQQD